MKGFFSREQIETQAVRHIDKDEAECITCGLYNKCVSPQMTYGGKGRFNALLLAEAPGYQEDQNNTQLVGPTGNYLQRALAKHNCDLYKDFWRFNAVNCRPTSIDGNSNRTPSSKEVDCCRPLVNKVIRELNPKFVIPMGNVALESLLSGSFRRLGVSRWRGIQIPDQKLKKWLMPIYHPSFPNRDTKNQNLQSFYSHDLRRIIKFIHANSNKEFPTYSDGKEKVDILTDHDTIIQALDRINKDVNIIHIDYETSGLKPYIPGHKIASVAITLHDKTLSFPYEYASFFTTKQRLKIKRGLRKIWRNPGIRKVAHNAKFEHIWTTNILDCDPVNWYWCTLQGAHIQDNRQKWVGLKFQIYINYGHRPWGDAVAKYLDAHGSPFNNIDKCPLEDLLLYGGLDVHWTRRLHRRQELFFSKPGNESLKPAFDLFNKGSIVLAEIQDNGVNVDEEYCHTEKRRLQKRIKVIEKQIETSEEAEKFLEHTSRELKLKDKDYSDDDLRLLYYQVLEQHKDWKKKKVDEQTLLNLDNAVANLILKRRKLRKIEGTYLGQFIRETFHGMMHPFFDLIVPVSYRGSSSNPNFQNIPKRDEQAKRATRRAIKPGPGNVLLESDFSGIEVCINACYNHDPTLIADVTDPTQDMHRDTAADIWDIPTDEVHKKLRFYAKNQWVFPQFYGSWYVQCAHNLWRTANNEKLKTNSGRWVIEHLADKRGIKTLEDFESHCRDVERTFWDVRFQVYAQWKKDIQYTYRNLGYIETYLGFRFSNYMGRNELTNYPAQGTAFHILLWTLINVHEEFKIKKMKSKLIGQIHDSMITDAHPDEVDDIIRIIDYWGTKRTIDTFKWITVPLKIDHEMTDVDGTWYDKKEIK